eukprot:GHRR01024902.1.p1 GENE.GHRR01024902.1~~GHRR01024902.1.p1  ORF type:complete len:440 (+),score=108.58 GHRR01024902.1:99-1418(+)
MGRVAEELIPLNVTTYGQGFLRLQGWITFFILAFLTAGLLVLYELIIINVEDQDFRDMLLDYRITQPGIRHQHRQFANVLYCCHHDPTVLKHSCSPNASYAQLFGSGPPYCPPVIQFTCPSLTSASCNNVRSTVYPAAGLDTYGQPSRCSTAGKVLLRASAGPGYKLTAYWQGQVLPQQQLTLPNDLSTLNASLVAEFIEKIATQHSDPMFRVPRLPLDWALSIDSKRLLLQAKMQDATADKWGQFGWPPELWLWPPGGPCTNTGTPPRLWLEGTYKMQFKPMAKDKQSLQPTVSISMFNQAFSVPQYRLVEDTNGTGGQMVSVQALTSLKLTVGLLAQLDGCDAWQLHKPGISASYDLTLWHGTPGQLAADRQPVIAGQQELALSLHDVSEPQPLALPQYHGELYVYMALVLGGVWWLATLLLVILLAIIVVRESDCT